MNGMMEQNFILQLREETGQTETNVLETAIVDIAVRLKITQATATAILNGMNTRKYRDLYGNMVKTMKGLMMSLKMNTNKSVSGAEVQKKVRIRIGKGEMKEITQVAADRITT